MAGGPFREGAEITVKRLLGIDKAQKLWKIVKQHGGVMGSLSHIFQTDELKDGKLIGVDQFGNKYYENNEYYIPRNRWCDYNQRVWLNYDASQIPPEWHRWLHHITDEPPSTHPPEKQPWALEHVENTSSTFDHSRYYVPYSTTRTKIEAWQPGGTEGAQQPPK